MCVYIYIYIYIYSYITSSEFLIRFLSRSDIDGSKNIVVHLRFSNNFQGCTENLFFSKRHYCSRNSEFPTAVLL